ncbi:hypothetical protein OKW30_000106 [Paraburkholderia sp. Clong3]
MSKQPAIASLAGDNLAAGGVAAVDRALSATWPTNRR